MRFERRGWSFSPSAGAQLTFVAADGNGDGAGDGKGDQIEWSDARQKDLVQKWNRRRGKKEKKKKIGRE